MSLQGADPPGAELGKWEEGAVELTELDSPTVKLEQGVALDDLIEDLTREFSLRADATGARVTRTACESLPLRAR